MTYRYQHFNLECKNNKSNAAGTIFSPTVSMFLLCLSFELSTFSNYGYGLCEMFCVVVRCALLAYTKKCHNWQLENEPLVEEVRTRNHSQTFTLSDTDSVTTEREKKQLWIGDLFQTGWDNEVRPGAPRLVVRIFHRATNTTWQLAAVSCFRLGCTDCQCPNSLAPLSSPCLNQHMAYCLLGHHHHRYHCRAIVLVLCGSIFNSHPPYLRAPPLLTPSPKLARSRPHTWRGYVTELRSWAVLSWHELNGLAAVCQGLFISQCRHWLIWLPQALGMEWGTRFELSTVQTCQSVKVCPAYSRNTPAPLILWRDRSLGCSLEQAFVV